MKAAGLVDTLKGPGPFTVFAPTDEASPSCRRARSKCLLKPENKAKLQSILTYHVVAGKVMAQDVVKLHSAKTVEGQNITIKTDEWRRDGGQRARDQDRYRGLERRDSRHRHRALAE